MAELESIVTPARKNAKVWKYFGYKPGKEGKKKVTCKLCGVKVVHGGGTTNLNTHLRNWHRSTYDELHPDDASTEGTSKQCTMDTYLSHVSKLPHHSERAKKLTNCVCEMIGRDLQPISIVDDISF